MNHSASMGLQLRKDKEQSLPRSSRMSSQSLFGSRTLNTDKCRREAKLTCRTVVRDYCNKTAVHGFRYFFEEERPALERTFWVCAVVVSFMGCFFLISKVWAKWDANPVIVTFSDTPTPVWQIPFPAVTICPSTKTRQSLFNYTLAQHHVLDNTATETENWKYQALSLVCLPQASADFQLNESASVFLHEVAPSVDEVLLECYWQNEGIPCSKYFRTVLTEEGICFSFNTLGARELFAKDTVQAINDPPSFKSSGWTVDGGYDDVDLTVKRFYPLRQVFVGPFTGLRVIAQSRDTDMDYVCRGCEQGFRVYLHNPAHDPMMVQHHTALSLDTSMYLLAKPTLMATTEGLSSYSPGRRSCYFSGERQLRYYRHYTLENCIYECYINVTIDKCGCVPIGVPRLYGVPMCSFTSSCSMTTYEKILNETESQIRFQGPFPEECSCLSSCKTLRYEGDGTAFDYPWRKEMLARRQNISVEGMSRSQLYVYFDTLQFVTSRRSELYGHTDFLANIGGLLGLFTGFSFISLVEVGYYASLRLWFDIRRRREERQRRASGTG